ncbi:MAG: HD domain-containing phosphohydrolase [Planctomycetota bacterium]
MRNESPSPRDTSVLIVDEAPVMSGLVSRVLDEEGYDCWPVESGLHALRLLNDRNFPLMISDVQVGGMSGVQLLKRAKKECGDRLAVVMTSEVDDRETAKRVLELGACGYLVKPIKANEILAQTINALERRRLVLQHKQHERRLEQKVREQTEELRASREEVCMRLVAAQDRRHDETGEHVRRIGRYCELIAREMGYDAPFVEAISLAASMHDVGKMAIPDRILQKPGSLSASEWEIMMTHTVHGWRILNNSEIDLLRLGGEIALTHHERWDGSGYPRGLAGPQIPRSGRIAAVADVYDALVSDRVYAPAKPLDEALETMRAERGVHFAPEVLDTFFELVPELQKIGREVAQERERVPTTEMQLQALEGNVSVRYTPEE